MTSQQVIVASLGHKESNQTNSNTLLFVLTRSAGFSCDSMAFLLGAITGLVVGLDKTAGL